MAREGTWHADGWHCSKIGMIPCFSNPRNVAARAVEYKLISILHNSKVAFQALSRD